jgi:hypothetical protein
LTRALAGRLALGALGLLALVGCKTAPPYDYAAFRQHPPRSILVLPPLNESTAVEGTYGYLSTVSRPLAELGYYVFPVAVIDKLMRENGLPTAGEMHEVSLDRLREVTGADSVLYLVLHQYGSQYRLLSSDTTVRVSARLVDTATGTLLWNGTGLGRKGSSGGSGLLENILAAAIMQAVNSKADPAHQVSQIANQQLFHAKRRELPRGPLLPGNGK